MFSDSHRCRTDFLRWRWLLKEKKDCALMQAFPKVPFPRRLSPAPGPRNLVASRVGKFLFENPLEHTTPAPVIGLYTLKVNGKNLTLRAAAVLGGSVGAGGEAGTTIQLH